MSSSIAIEINKVDKCYQIYGKPEDRLRQFFEGALFRFFNKHPKKFHREFWAIRDFSLTIKRGETVGIIGRNGSGKSTLLQMICGTLNPTSGTINTFGRVAALLELGSGFNPEFTGRENIFLNAAILGLSSQEISERYQRIIDFADIGDFVNQPIKTYSSGMLVRLAFAVIAHVDADILIIDEALAVGDAFFTQKCMRFLRSFMKTGTVLFVSHDTASVKALCTKAVWLEMGQIVKVGSPKSVCEDYLQAFYEVKQGAGTTTALKSQNTEKATTFSRDQRDGFINASNLRNDIQIFEFDQESPSFGKGLAQITDVFLSDTQYNKLGWVVGGEDVILSISAHAHSHLHSPIIGFFIKDKLGQYLFGDNTYLTYIDNPLSCALDDVLTARFSFQMPRLAAGEYSITVAIADGTQDEHIQHHWIHDALMFKSESTSVAGGIIGIPMAKIKLELKNA